MPETRRYVVILKKWNKPEIIIGVTPEEIGIVIEIDKFIEALSLEVKHPAKLVTRKMLEKSLIDAKNKIIREMKEQYRYVPPAEPIPAVLPGSRIPGVDVNGFVSNSPR